MNRLVAAFAVVLAFTFAAHAIVQQTETTISQTGTEIKTSTVTITQTGKEKTTDTFRTSEGKKSSKKKIKIDTKKTDKIEASVTTEKKDGKTETVTVPVEVSILINGGTITLVPGVTLTSNPVTAGPPSTPRLTTPAAPPSTPPLIPTDGGGAPSGWYGGLVGGWANAGSAFTPTGYGSAGAAEAFTPIRTRTSNDDFTFGGIIGYGFPGTPVALEAQLTWLNNEATIQGVPGNIFAASRNDTLTIQKDWMVSLSGLYHFPGPVQNSTWFAKAGIALIREEFTHNCPSNGWCGVAPATSSFSSSDKTWAQGLVLGGGLQFQTAPIFGAPSYLRLYYEHVFVREYDVSTGSLPTRAISGNVDQDIDRVAIGLFIQYSQYSDIRLKRDIVPIAQRTDGLTLYRYRYLWSDTEYVGVMAQEVAESRSDAVLRGADGFLRVDYGRLGTRLMMFDEWSTRERVAHAF